MFGGSAMSTKMCPDCDGDGNCPVCHGKGDILGDEISDTSHEGRRWSRGGIPTLAS